MTREIVRHQLSPADRELFDLRYLDPTDEDTFARNLITNLFDADAEGQARPLVTIYAAPTAVTEVELSRLLRRLDDTGLHSYAPAAARTGPLVPGLRRTISTGVIAHDGNRDFTHLGSALVLRTTGSVELVDGDATVSGRGGQAGVYLCHTLVHVAQLLNYLVPYGESLERPEWTLRVNVRDASRAVLGDFHSRFQSVVITEPRRALERHLQFRASVQPADEKQAQSTVQQLDEYLSFAYGYREPRGHAENGRLTER